MRVKELIKELEKYNPEQSITISALAMRQVKKTKDKYGREFGCCNMFPSITIKKDEAFNVLDLVVVND